ncbi:sugar nucleotide-binding protein [Candidatus Daviesbacteria bacterium]|nr:sugar nucleotide-binding protein [Candidatus Daviesbacteria bacterium]
MPNLDKLLVIGSGSLVGSRFVELLPSHIKVWGAGGSFDKESKLESFSKLDITNSNEVLEVIRSSPVNYVINFAGATAVDEIEKTRPSDPNDQKQLNENLAYRINVIGTRNIINAAVISGKFPIFISTGFVFDGKNGPYSEEDPVATSPNEVSWYGWTKVLAEKQVSLASIDYLMLRISYPYRGNFPHKGDFARNFLTLYDDFKSGKKDSIYPIFADQTLTPTFIDDLSKALITLLEKRQTGIFHITSPEITTPFDFASEVLKVARRVDNPEQLLTKGSLVEFHKSHPYLATRPLKGGEKSEKIARLGFRPTSWKEGIKKAFGF